MTQTVDDKLHSDAPVVLVEAPAGCGKTWTAAKFANDSAPRAPERRVLLLSHTHAACGEFHRKCHGDASRVTIDTCDSFCLKTIAPYAHALGLPTPLEAHLDRPGGIPFADLSTKTVELFTRAPTIARAVSSCFPLIILDEHQDASKAQHDVIRLLREIGTSRLRIFGDPMQALHVGDAEGYVAWDDLRAFADVNTELEEPHRWKDAPALGQWLKAARTTLKAGNPISFRNAPSIVVSRHQLFCGRDKFKDFKAAAPIVRNFLDSAAGDAALLAFRRPMTVSIAQLSAWRAPLNEGAQLDRIAPLVAAMEQLDGNAGLLAQSFLAFAGDIGAGLNENDRLAIAKRLGGTINISKAGAKQLSWLACCEPIYSSPNHRGVAQAMRLVRENPPDGYTLRLSGHAWAVSSFERTDDPRGYLSALGRVRRRWALPTHVTSTIHKAKGLAFDRVLICPLDRNQFPDDVLGARLLYVAMSRARRSIRIALVTDALPAGLIAD